MTAIASLLFGTFGMVPIAVPLAIAALLRLRRSGKSGSSLAISGLLLSAGWTVIGVVAALLFIGATASDRTSLSGLKPGDCLNGTDVGESLEERLLTDCSKPHRFQVLSTELLPEGPYPGRQNVSGRADELCTHRWLTRLLQSPYADSHEFLILAPTADSWLTDRTIVCLLESVSGKTAFAVDLAAVKVDPRKKTWSGLRPGDCLNLPKEATVLVRTIPCDRPHTDQIVKSFSLPEGPWPGQEEVDETIGDRCDDMLNAFFEKNPPYLFLDYYGISPDSSDWAAGNRRALCAVSPIESDFLRRSLVP